MTWTLIVVIVYFLIVLGIAGYVAKNESIDTYYLNQKKTSLWFLVFSHVATFVGAGSTVAVVSEVYNSGISFGIALPFSFLLGMVIMGIVAKKIRSAGETHGIYSIVDYFAIRFDAKNKTLVFITQLVLLVIWLAVQMSATATLVTTLTGISFHTVMIIAVIITILYSSLGGLKADILTDFFQFWVIIIVFICMSIYGYIHIGSFENLFANLPAGHLDIFGYGGVARFVGALLFGGLVYLANTGHWQRILSAKNPQIAYKSFFYAIPWMLLISGMVLFFGLLASATLSHQSQDMTLFLLMDTILPPRLVGIGFASILAVIMSSVDSLLVGGSTIIYRSLFQDKTYPDTKKMILARLITMLFGIVGGSITFLFPSIVSLSLFVSYLTLIFVPAILAGLYSKNISADASSYSMLGGIIVLGISFPIVGKNSFLLSTGIVVAILFLYDVMRRMLVKKDELSHRILGE